jgi:zinc and cadmium transporter
MISLILLRSTIATVVAWIGAVIGFALGSKVSKRLDYLVTAALGALLAVTIFDILPDAAKLLRLPVLILATASGALLFWLIARFVYPICPACSSPADDNMVQTKLTRTVVLLTVALGVHSTMDGAAVVIGDTLAHGANTAIFFAVSLHKLPEGIALVLLLIGAGLSRRSALIYSICVETATELGALIALFLVTRLPEAALGMIFANIGGGFLYLVSSTLLLERNQAEKLGGIQKRLGTTLTGAVGFLSTYAIMQIGQVMAR